MEHPEEQQQPEHVQIMHKITEEVMAWRTNTERENLMNVFRRFCIHRGVPIEESIEHLHASPAGKNQTNYYYKFGSNEQAFLMTATFSISDTGMPKLDIDFNPTLAYNNTL